MEKMKNIPKKTLLIGIAILILVSAGIVGISAYLTSTDGESNTMKIGGVNVEIVEEFDPPKEIKPGTVITKDVKVKNNGPSEAYVRVKAVFTDSDMGKYCEIDWNTEDYVYNEEEGYYYFKDKLAVGDITTSLFTTITVSEDIPESEIKDFDVLVYTEAYQSEGFSDYSEAWRHYRRNNPNN